VKKFQSARIVVAAKVAEQIAAIFLATWELSTRLQATLEQLTKHTALGRILIEF
jgi:hypothetical protein